MEATASTPAPEVAAAAQQAPAAVPTGRHLFSSRWTVRDILGREDGGVGLVDQEGVVAGWIRTVRFGNKGKLAFINLNDGSLITGLQVVCDSNKEGFDQLKATDCSAGASIWIFGKVVKSPAKGQTVEFLASKVALVGGCDPLTYPLAGKGHSVEFLREQAHLRARTNTVRLQFIQSFIDRFGRHLFSKSLNYFCVATATRIIREPFFVP
jgi:asparaginyl-tRNA synthetase